MFTSAFSFNLNNPVEENLSTILRLDSQKPQLACVSIGGKLFISNNEQVEFLNLNKSIKSLATSKYDPDSNSEQIIFASQNTLVCYDVLKNSENFYKEIEDGINVIAFTPEMSGIKGPVTIIGGNCSIQGFNSQGDEIYWNVTSDLVTCIGFTDIDGDQSLELMVGSADNYIRIFQGESILYEIQEASKPLILSRMTKQKFAFGLENGMVGVYQKKQRKWRAKSQYKPIGVLLGDFGSERQGYKPIIIGRQNGQIEIRHDATGEILHKVMLSSPLAKIFRDDFRQDGSKQIACIQCDGQVQGYIINIKKENFNENATLTWLFRRIKKKKQNLVEKINNLQNQVDMKKTDGISPQEQLNLINSFKINPKTKNVELCIKCKNLYIKNAILFCEKLFVDSETLFYCPKNVKNTLNIPLPIQKNISEKITVKCMLSNTISSQYYQVFTFTSQLPKFSRYLFINTFEEANLQAPISQVNMIINERISRFVKWISQSFIVNQEIIDKLEQNQTQLVARFVNIQNRETLQISIDQNNAHVQIFSDDIEVAGDVIQDMCQYNNITELESQGQFPQEMEKFKQILDQVKQYSEAKMNITADIADSIQQVKTFIVKAEDSRICGDMKFMKKYYSDVMVQNNNLMTELIKRKKNNNILMSSLKEINSMINKASNIRLGNAKTRVTTLCRNAIKNKDFFSLLRIIEGGQEY
ncbi:hypothetical protein IMG5_156790 [Ichthyophthirius multifiliis]|uniref:Bardet-biedl syndrome 2 protein n=1 Tax=Ichthyophthirius multifiliis TaxID=5932 RepID=G0QZH2_ICHMU|nr:hypothetical protein IMG5_156790 [Ichthyophthirius multifiliis]EGR29382.1 hypothetical protein IMG5_156790 [Ichthyophthirius multifiliis]|eukprot:XP_004030618.1 hypothetical protein IMG5_156790 [Ichthyophthirius multifiliis]